ncbi:thermonuclease family protein [Vallitalea pronyensis]|uniref:Thermonuclease family protein n=2 Tax=Vallitalea pronyensis TaxID=1348613 RepID=A0A8J8SJM3_9FIRM|nr:thermonuclease family protein [Vallitalea pronyensis]
MASLMALSFLVFFDIDINHKNVNVAKEVFESARSIILSITEDTKYDVGIVSRVVDGDTIAVTINGKEEKVRFIGVNTPESVGRYANKPQPYGKEASAYTKAQLDGKKVYLQKDVSDRDKYGRLLRYVWLGEPDKSKLEEQMFNAILIKEGYGNVMTYPPDVKYSKIFVRLEEGARENDRGLWALE